MDSTTTDYIAEEIANFLESYLDDTNHEDVEVGKLFSEDELTSLMDFLVADDQLRRMISSDGSCCVKQNQLSEEPEESFDASSSDDDDISNEPLDLSTKPPIRQVEPVLPQPRPWKLPKLPLGSTQTKKMIPKTATTITTIINNNKKQSHREWKRQYRASLPSSKQLEVIRRNTQNRRVARALMSDAERETLRARDAERKRRKRAELAALKKKAEEMQETEVGYGQKKVGKYPEVILL